jgi:hypothetical protein
MKANINSPFLLALAGATTGATFAVLKNAPVKQYTISTGLNCGVFGATFFCKVCHINQHFNW